MKQSIGYEKKNLGTKSMGELKMTAAKWVLTLTLLASALLWGCTQETQNRMGRAIINWTGTDGVLEIYAGDKLVRRFIKIDKLSTAAGTSEKVSRPYRFGYGHLDLNLNFKKDPEEKKVYFEISDFATNYVFFENPY